MKVKFTKLAALLLAGVALFATGCTDYEVDIQRNADAIASVKDQIAALQATIATLETAADHKADVDKLNKAITDLQSELNGKIAELTTEVGKKLDKSEFETAKKQLSDAIDAVAARVKAIEDANFQKQLDDLKADVATKATKAELEKAVEDLTKLVNGEIAKLDTRITNLEAAVKKINEETIPAINTQISNLQSQKLDKSDFEAYKTATATTLKLMQDAIDELGKTCATKEELKDAVDKILALLQSDYATKKALEDALAKAMAAIDDVKGAIRSLVFAPEVYVDGVEAILVSTFKYNPLTLKDADKVSENAVADTASFNVTPIVTAKYHVIPSDADLSFLTEGDTVKFVLREKDPFIVSRAAIEPTKDFSVTGIYRGLDKEEVGVIDIEVKVTGKPAEDELISVVALQLQNGTEIYTSDYATIFSQDIADIRIADRTKKEEPSHYRRATETISKTDSEAAIADLAAWTEQFDTLSVDHQMAYDAAFDLNEYVIAHFLAPQEEPGDGEEGEQKELKCDGPNEKIFEGLGFTWKFELVKNYKVGNSEMFNLSDEGVLTAKDGNAINLTPIVRVTMVDPENDNNNVQIAYVKVWVAPSAKDTDITWSKDKKKTFDIEDQFEFKCEGDTLVADSTVLYKKIYNLFPITKTNFDAAYPTFVKALDPKVDTLGTVSYDPKTGELSWIMTAEELWPIASDPKLKEGEIPVITHKVAFEAINGAQVVVTLKADVKPVAAYKIPVERYIESYWTTGEKVPGTEFSEGAKYEFALYNVFTPAVGDTASAKCLFDNNINAAFFQDKTGVIDLAAIPELNLPAVGEPGLEITSIQYFFCKEMEDIKTIGDFKVEFEVSADSLSLLATIKNAEEMKFPELKNVQDTIATINNEAGGIAPNIVSLNKNSDVAKALLNTMAVIGKDGDNEVPSAGELYIYIGAIGKICGDDNGEGGFDVKLYWPKAWYDEPSKAEWQDHFAAKYRQPVYLSTSAGDSFIDAVDFGEGGSFITVKDLVNPKDWRARPFDEQKDKFGNVKPDQVDGINYFSNYWSYYGPIDIQVDTLNIKCNLGTGGVVIDLPVSISVRSGVAKDDLKDQIVDLTLPYREKDQTNASGLTIDEKIEALSAKAGQFGFFTYKNNGTNVTRDFEMYVPVKMTYGWGVLEKTITVKVFKTVDSFQKQ